MSEAGSALYDPVELRRRIVFCFSVGELKALADSLGVGGIAWERGLQEAAREVVRQSERYAGLPALVAKLREVRPLVEWPEPTAAPGLAAALPAELPAALPAETDAARSVAPAGAAPALPAAAMPFPSPAGSGFPAHPALSASPGMLGPSLGNPGAGVAPRGEPAPMAPPLFDPYAPPPGPPAIHVPVPAPPASSAPWPGVVGVGEPEAPSRGVDPRILVAVAGLMVVAAVIAYLAGRASSVATAPETAPAASASAAPGPARGDGPAALATDALARSFANLARVCELPASAGTNALVFKRVFERCGPGAPPRRSYSPSAQATADAGAEPAAPGDPAPGRNKRPGRGGDPAPTQAAPAAKGCMGTCDAQHGACRSRCGPEPTEGSGYDGYQHCMGRCLSDASRCRLGCR